MKRRDFLAGLVGFFASTRSLAAAGQLIVDQPPTASLENIERIIGDLSGENQDLAIRTRYSGTAGSRVASDYVAERFAELGLEPAAEGVEPGGLGYVQEWMHRFDDHRDERTGEYRFGRYLEAFPDRWEGVETDRGRVGIVLRNIVGKKPGVTGKRIIVGAHYDSINSDADPGNPGFNLSSIYAPGANDNASGVSAMMEIARITKGCPHEIVYIAFAAEENSISTGGGRIGSRFYAARMPDREDALFYVNLDEIGRFETCSLAMTYSPAMRQQYQDLAGLAKANRLAMRDFSPFASAVAPYTDAQSFDDAGVPWVFFHQDFHGIQPFDAISHTSQDVIQTMNLELVKRTAQTIARFLQTTG